MANKMADKKKNANQSSTRRQSQSQMVAPPARSDGKEQDKAVKAVARERDELKVPETKTVRRDNKSQQDVDAGPVQRVRETKTVRRDNKSQSKGPSDWQIRLRNNRYIRFILDAYYELRHKVTWPSFNEARTMTIVVILLSAAVGLLLWVADLGLYQLFLLLNHIGGK